jgi:Flp pilus assembly protein TadB
MSWLKDLVEFILDKEKIHQLFLILPPITFFLTRQPFWLFLSSMVILAILEVYKTDLKAKTKLVIKGRVKAISQNRPLLRSWKEQIRDAGKEFSYMFSWPFFGMICLIFIGMFIYSTIISWHYSKLLFAVHIFLIVFMIMIWIIIGYNLRQLASKQKRKRKVK